MTLYFTKTALKLQMYTKIFVFENSILLEMKVRSLTNGKYCTDV